MSGELKKIHQLLQRSEQVPQSVLDLLQDTVIGTNGLQYQLKDTADKIHQLHRPHFLYLERNDQSIGNITICKRHIKINEEVIDSNYLRYFAFNKIFQGSGEKRNSNSAFHKYFKALFETSNFDPINPKKDKALYWAFIDPENLRSFSMNEKLGFQTIGQFKTTAFSRISPKSSPFVRKSTAEEEDHILALTRNFYKDFNFFSDVHLFANNNYYVFVKDGEILAGIQANPIRWKVLALPGISGKFMLKSLPYIPGIKKLMNPMNHRFLATEGLFWMHGYESYLEEFLSGILAMSNHHSVLLWTDDQNNMLEKLDVRWGLMNKIKSDNHINIVAKFIDFQSVEVDEIKSKKKYLSGFDMT